MLKKIFRAKEKKTDIFLLRAVFFFSANAANFRSGKKNCYGRFPRHLWQTWCVRGPHDSTGDEARLILTPPTPTLAWTTNPPPPSTKAALEKLIDDLAPERRVFGKWMTEADILELSG